ncbi:MAG: Do family serine endopeptidase [Acidobacteria bacterium]|nr:Do family serine endopeptidase [Acidobacteriota bacterium]MBV9146655.1 Do family serine endopeptidase [Acidobacteriota bacterium]MBV9435426.1 Do family serine endopeptidase [Acidobacteriota bacterium]
MSIKNLKTALGRRVLAPALALATIASFGAYECLKPAAAHASSVMSSAPAPLDENSVGALLSIDHAMETLAARVTPATVNVTVTSKRKVDLSDEGVPEGFQNIPGFGQFFGQQFGQRVQPQNRVEHGLGSGVIISPDGYIVTNNHVIDGAVDINVTMSDRRVFAAKLVGRDPMTDLAVLKINGTNFPSVPLGDSTQLHPGQTVLAFGNPYGFRFTVTRGIVSALNRPNPDLSDRRKPGEFIQTDAAINPGNSGGPLVDARGEVVGINTFLISDSGAFSGMGFAIPTQIVRPIVNEIMRDGKVRHAYMGVGINDVTPENSKFFNVAKAQGAVVSEVQPDSPGAKAGLKVGDVITRIDGREVTDAGQLQVEVSQLQPGTTVKLDVMRDGKNLNLPITVEELGGKNSSERASNPEGKARWGVGLGDLDSDTRQQIQAPESVRGAVVEQVQPGSPADNAGLSSGDVILQVNHKPVTSAKDAKDLLSSIPTGQDALVLVWSNGGSSFRVMKSGNNS